MGRNAGWFQGLVESAGKTVAHIDIVREAGHPERVEIFFTDKTKFVVETSTHIAATMMERPKEEV